MQPIRLRDLSMQQGLLRLYPTELKDLLRQKTYIHAAIGKFGTRLCFLSK